MCVTVRHSFVIHAKFPTCYHVKFSSSVTKGVRINRREPHKLRSAGPVPVDWGTSPLPACYDVKFDTLDSCLSNDVCINKREPPKLVSAWAGAPSVVVGAWLTPRNTLFPYMCYSLVISRPWSRDSSALEFILSRSRSRDLMAKVSVLVSRPEDPGLGLGLETWSPKSWSWSRDLKTQVSVSRPEDPGLGLGLETWSPRSRSWSRDLKTQVLVSGQHA